MKKPKFRRGFWVELRSVFNVAEACAVRKDQPKVRAHYRETVKLLRQRPPSPKKKSVAPAHGAKEVMRIGEVARMLGVSTQSVRRWEKEGRLQSTFRTPGGNRFYKQSEVERFSAQLKKPHKNGTIRAGVRTHAPRGSREAPPRAPSDPAIYRFRTNLRSEEK